MLLALPLLQPLYGQDDCPTACAFLYMCAYLCAWTSTLGEGTLISVSWQVEGTGTDRPNELVRRDISIPAVSLALSIGQK